ncbi:MAG: hypothetical protein V9E81_01180 [Marmoricola sp.]|jgi:hypothetical protein
MDKNQVAEQRVARVVELVEHCVKTELQVTAGIRGLDLDDATLEELAGGVTAGLLYAFEMDWSPDWVRPGEVHQWQENGMHTARCSVCLADSVPTNDRNAATTWAESHAASHRAH